MPLLITRSIFHKFKVTPSVSKLSNKLLCSGPPEAILIEKSFEGPIIVLREEDNVDIIGPPDSLSNLRPIIRKSLRNETVLQRHFRETANAIQIWNQEFWANHNTNFLKEKAAFVKKHRSDKNHQLNADEMSEFYKEFLDKNWERHVKYNFEWYSKNFTLLYLALKVSIEQLKLKMLW
ncbi:APOPT family protein CG14806, mitochondrial [Sitophilus oryzae]|uniref:APOPT family protein CG14806, mitochondrial n=1 Tax=Sitophilus oryzae TaxID=7048 RepID=A0A6J2YJP2_SITOR|nr:APOPT family protein CG14806, mitochondrial [Sitophilus oryzae]